MPRTDGFVTVNGLEIHYSDWGPEDGTPVLCVHGLSRVGRDFDGLAEALSDEYRVYCIDMPGRGLSEWAEDDAAYTASAMVELLVAFCDELGLEEFVWVGTSMGGQLGIGAAAGPLRERISHLVINDVGPMPAEDESAEAGIDRIIEYLTNPTRAATLTGLEAFYRENYATFSAMTDEEWRTFAITSARRGDDGQFTPAYDTRIVEPLLTATPDVDPWEVWEAIEAPTLVLRGEHSDILPAETLAEMKERRPEIETLVVEGCGHAPVLNVPEQVDPIREFLA
jgi:pimeloyl-ACP methyl ester carboxylesterase